MSVSHVICTVTGLSGAGGSSRKLIGQSGANGRAGRGLRVTWATGEARAEKSKALQTGRTQRDAPAGSDPSKRRAGSLEDECFLLTSMTR